MAHKIKRWLEWSWEFLSNNKGFATVTKGGTLPDTGVTKAEVYALVDSATVSAIVNADVADAAAIEAKKLAFAGITTALTYTSNKPRRSIILTAAGAVVPATNGAEQAQTNSASAGQACYYTLNFDGATDEYAYWTFIMPDSYDDGDVYATAYYLPADGSTAGDTLQLTLAFHDVAANGAEAVDAAFGTATDLDDVILNATPNNELHATPETTIAAANFADAGEMVVCRLTRDVSDDDMTEDAKVFAVKIEYSADLESD